ncbi:unnamed protein product [Spirodela intermedia]|uniref:GATA-type domain-containing protein n=1 Tax=Spirodela intermedia TaxID=51605 RepID=A0A7I8K3U5_SPIIN|nr:unnamed protein product [Spirodela intermedia]
MAPELDVGMSMGMGIGVGMMPMGLMGMDGGASSSFSTAYLCGLPTTDGLPIDDLLDFSNQDDLFDSTVPGYAAESHQSHHPLPSHGSAAPAVGSFDTSGSNLSTFSDDLYVPSEEAAELEWLSKFVDDSFADVPFPSSPGGCGNGLETIPSSISGGLRGDPSAIPGRARSKRSRAPAAALQHPTSTWSTPEPPQPSAFSMSPTSSSSSLLEFPPCSATSKLKAAAAACGGRKKEMAAGPGMESGVRRCTHCSSEKTPQWRSGPLGPKTLWPVCLQIRPPGVPPCSQPYLCVHQTLQLPPQSHGAPPTEGAHPPPPRRWVRCNVALLAAGAALP